MRPKGKSDLQIMWAIRDIPRSIIQFKHKGFLLILLSIIGNKETCQYSFPEMEEIFCSSARHLRDIITFLEQIKFIFVARPSKKGRHHKNTYCINYELLLSLNRANYALFAESIIGQTAPYLPPEIGHESEINRAPFAYPYKDNKQEIKKERENIPISNRKNEKPMEENYTAKKHIWIIRKKLKHPGMKHDEVERQYDELMNKQEIS